MSADVSSRRPGRPDSPALPSGGADLALALGLARRALLLMDALAHDGALARADWRRVAEAAVSCLQRLDALAATLGVAPEQRPLPALLRARLYRARDTLQETTPERLAAFGPLAPRTQQELAVRLAALWPILERLRGEIGQLPEVTV